MNTITCIRNFVKVRKGIKQNLIDNMDVSSSGLGRSPDMRTKNSYDQYSKLPNHVSNDIVPSVWRIKNVF